MKTTKNIFLIIALVTTVITFFNGCKKGDGDPFLSFHSRKARVVGEWAINNWKQESNSTGNGTSDNSKIEINEGSVSISQTTIDNSGTSIKNGTGSATAKITFSKDGTFKRTMQLSVNNTYSGASYTAVSNSTVETSGTWNFFGGVEKDYKNKERIVLNILKESSNYNLIYSDGDNSNESYSDSYANGENIEVWHLSTLKNKELIMDGEINNTSAYNASVTYNGQTTNVSGSSSEKGTVNGTLTQK